MSVGFEVNFLAVIVAVIADQIIGTIWYGALFKNMWLKMMGVTSKKQQEDMKKESGPAMAASALASLVTAYVLAHVLPLLGAIDVATALTATFWLWAGLVAASLVPAYAYEGRNKGLYFLYSGYRLVAMGAMAVILVMWV